MKMTNQKLTQTLLTFVSAFVWKVFVGSTPNFFSHAITLELNASFFELFDFPTVWFLLGRWFTMFLWKCLGLRSIKSNELLFSHGYFVVIAFKFHSLRLFVVVQKQSCGSWGRSTELRGCFMAGSSTRLLHFLGVGLFLTSEGLAQVIQLPLNLSFVIFCFMFILLLKYSILLRFETL